MGERIRIKGKVCLLGDAAVGKTSLIRRFVLDQYDDKYISTVGTKVTKKKMDFEFPDLNSSVEVTLLIWDIMGQARNVLKSTLSQYERYIPQKDFYRNAKAAIIVCDITRKDTFEHIEYKNEVSSQYCILKFFDFSIRKTSYGEFPGSTSETEYNLS